MENRKETLTNAKTHNQRTTWRKVNGITNKTMYNRSYLEPNSSSMQKPIEGLSPQALFELYKETI
jgi:hypothetical protein